MVKITGLLLGLVLAVTGGCRSEVIEVSGPQLLKIFGNQKLNEQFVMRKDISEHVYLDCFRLGKTESQLRQFASFRTATTNLTPLQIELLGREAVLGRWGKMK